MGKRSLIISGINIVSLIVKHKILFDKGEHMEAKDRLQHEIERYSEEGFEITQDHSFNEAELAEIEEKSVKQTISKLGNRYPDVNFTEQDIRLKVKETMEELRLK